MKIIDYHKISYFLVSFDTLKVGVAGFEPATSASQTRRDNRATLHPDFGYLLICGETGIRTPGTLLGYDDLANRSFRPLRHLSNSTIRTSHSNADANVAFHLKEHKHFIYFFVKIIQGIQSVNDKYLQA